MATLFVATTVIADVMLDMVNFKTINLSENGDSTMVRLLSCAALLAVAISAIATYVGAGDQKPLEEPKASSGQATTADKKNPANPFEGRIVLIYGVTGEGQLLFENARVESVFGRELFVGDQVVMDEDSKDEPRYIVTGATHFFPWERVAGCIATPSQLIGKRVDNREAYLKQLESMP